MVAIVGLLWSSLGFFQSLVSAINQAWGQQPLNWWKLPLQNLKMLGILLSALLLGTILPAILGTVDGYHSFGAANGSRLPVAIAPGPRAVRRAVLRLPDVLQTGSATANQLVTFSEVWVPALLVTALLQDLPVAVDVLFDSHITNFNAVYGALRWRGGDAAVDLSLGDGDRFRRLPLRRPPAHQSSPGRRQRRTGKPAHGIVPCT